MHSCYHHQSITFRIYCCSCCGDVIVALKPCMDGRKLNCSMDHVTCGVACLQVAIHNTDFRQTQTLCTHFIFVSLWRHLLLFLLSIQLGTSHIRYTHTASRSLQCQSSTVETLCVFFPFSLSFGLHKIMIMQTQPHGMRLPCTAYIKIGERNLMYLKIVQI